MSSLLRHRIHGTLIRLLYRIIAPGHPRGWLDFHAVFENDDNPTTMWIHCHGMERWNLPNVELVGVPCDLSGYAHGIIFEIVGYMKSTKRIEPDDDFSGFLVGANQRCCHVATMRAAPSDYDDEHRSLLRIVDYGEPPESGFPYRLFATHICELAERDRNLKSREAMYRRAIEIFPGSPALRNEDELARYKQGINVNNYLGWEGLGEALCEQGRFEEGLACLEQAVARCPPFAEDFKEHVLQMASGEPRLVDVDPRFRFWIDVDVDEVHQRLSG